MHAMYLFFILFLFLMVYFLIFSVYCIFALSFISLISSSTSTHSPLPHNNHTTVHVLFFFSLFDFRGRGSEGGREEEKYQLAAFWTHPDWGLNPQSWHVLWPGNWTSDLSVCGTMPNQLSHASQGGLKFINYSLPMTLCLALCV